MTSKNKKKLVQSVVLAVIATAAVILLALNLSAGERKINHRIAHLYNTGDAQFVREMGNLLGPPLVGGNRVSELLNGDEIFPAMLEAIRGAKRTITFETYIYWSGQIGEEFANALTERSAAGVKVHVLLDWVGSGKMDQTTLERMENAGIQVERYHPLHWYTLTRLNHRTHRKFLVVDGRVGFTGGVGIGDLWLGNAQDEDHWRDSHYRLEGPAVAHMQAGFLDNWLKTHSEVLHGEDYFPALVPVGDASAQVFLSSSREGSESVRMMYLLSIAAASRSILLSVAYFVPDDLSVQMLVEARKRGVRVVIITPGPKIDVEIDPQGLPVALGGPPRGGRRDLGVPAHDVSRQGHDRGRDVGVGRIDELRQPVLSPERRSEPERPGPPVRGTPHQDLRRGQGQVAPDHLRGVAEYGLGAKNSSSTRLGLFRSQI